MNKLEFETPDMTQKNIEKIAQLFPNCITESKDENGKLKKAVNFELLQQMLKCDIADKDEAYEFTWVGKNAAIVEANKPIRKTLRPCKEESVDWNTTENLYIEGDNLEVLKLLQESYLGKVKMIYIDPPYNTGNDFIYRDDFTSSREEYEEEAGAFDDEGNRMFKNTDTNGRFHSDWCSMIYSRLMLARNLLSDDGVIFISIDDNEVDNLKKICNEIFGESNFISILNWKGRGGRQDSKYYAAVHEYILCYARSKNSFIAGEEIKSGDVYPKYDKEKKCYYKTQLLRKWGSNSRREDRPNLYYPIKAPDDTDLYPIIREANGQRPSNLTKFDGRWRWAPATMNQAIKDGRVEFLKTKDGEWIAYEKIFAPLEGEEKTKKYTTWIEETNNGANTIKDLFGKNVFDYSKSSSLIKRFLEMGNVEDDDIILDFFSGSATTAHAVMQLNAEDGGNRKFIMVQLPEPCDEKSEAYKAGYKNICEIGKERIRRAGKKISEQWLVDSEQKKGGKNGCSKLQGIADMAEGNADCEGDLFTGEETSQGRDLCSIRPNEAGSSVDSVKHSGGAVKEFNEGVHSLPVDNERLKGGTRNTASSLQGNRISDGRGNSTSDELVARGKQNALYDESKTDNSQLTTDNCPLDIGFRVLKVDDTNMKDVYYSPSEYDQGKLDGLENNIKEDRNDLDLLFGCLLDWGLPLSLSYTSESIGKFTVHTYNNGDLIACFNENVSEDVVKEIARKKPLRAVFRDSSFSNSASKINVCEIFKMISPETSVKVI